MLATRRAYGSRATRSPVPPAARRAIPRRSLPVALFEFLSGAAPTRLVAPGQLARSGRGDRLPVPAGARGCARSPGAGLRLLRLLFLLRLLRSSDSHAQDGLGDATGDTRLHFLEEAVGLALVGDERVLLAVAAKVDALAELLHRGEMLDPVRVDRAEEDPSLDGAG